MVTLLEVETGTRGHRPVVGLGLCVVDHVYRVEDFAAGERTRYTERLVSTGGMAANALVQVAALGVRAQLMSLVGDDADGRWLLRSLRERGVATRRVVRSPELPTTTAVILAKTGSGERRFVLPDRRAIERRAPDFDLAAIRRRTVLLVDGHFARQAKAALRCARERGATTVADFAVAKPAFGSMLRFVDFPIVPRQYVDSAGLGSPRDALRWLHAKTGGTPVVTLGAAGALALVDGRFCRIRPHRVRVRDTTGAGDAFHGAFVAGLARTMPVLAALDLASRAGAYACRALGATRSLLVGS
jgi:sulfofructose kinase